MVVFFFVVLGQGEVTAFVVSKYPRDVLGSQWPEKGMSVVSDNLPPKPWLGAIGWMPLDPSVAMPQLRIVGLKSTCTLDYFGDLPKMPKYDE